MKFKFSMHFAKCTKSGKRNPQKSSQDKDSIGTGWPKKMRFVEKKLLFVMSSSLPKHDF